MIKYICELKRECKFYDRNSYTCNYQLEKRYCGRYKILNKTIPNFILILGIFLLFSFLLVSTINSQVIDKNSIKTFTKLSNEKYGTITIKDKNYNTLIEYKLLYNTDNCLINCYAEGIVTLNQDSKLYEDIEFYNTRNLNKVTLSKYKKYYSDETRTYEVDRERVEPDCKIKTDDLSGCGIKVIKYKETITENIWKDATDVVLTSGVYKWRIEGKKSLNQNLDWIIKIDSKYGDIKLNEWAVWSSSFNNNITAYYNFTTDVNLTDIATGKRNLSNNGNALVVPTGKIGEGYYLDGTGDFLNTTNAPFVPLLNDFSFNVWINITTASNDERILGNLDGSNNGFTLYLTNPNKYLSVYAQNGEYNIVDNVLHPNAVWMMVTIVRNSTGMYGYKNGTLFASEIQASGNIGSGGAQIGFGSSIGLTNFEGTMDEIGWWNRSLSYQEIQDLYNGGAGLTWSTGFVYPPTVTLNSPPDNTKYIFSPSQVTLNCSISHADYLVNGSIIINDVYNYTWYGNGVINSTDITIMNNFSDGVYKWYCIAFEKSNTSTTSSSRNFTIDQTNYTINNLGYNTIAFETDYENFTVNITYNNLYYTNLTVKLNYNGTLYDGTRLSGTNNTLFYKTFDIPENYKGNNSIYWIINLTNSSGFSLIKNTTNFSQYVNQTLFGFCNSSNTKSYLNISFKDEKDLTSINASVTTSTFTYWLGNGSVKKTFTYSNSTDNFYYPFCFSPTYKSLNYNLSNFQYYKTSYPQRIYNDFGILTNSSTNKVLYLLSTTYGQYVTFQVINNANVPISNVEANATTTIDSVTSVVGLGSTDAAGSITFWLNPDNLHTFSFYRSDVGYYTTSLYPTQTSYTVTLGELNSTPAYDYNKGIVIYFSPSGNNLTNNTQYDFKFNLTSSYWLVESFGFVLTNGSMIIGSVSSGTNGGVLTVTNNTNNFTTIIMNYYYVINGTYSNGSTSWIIFNDYGDDWSLRKFFSDLRSYADSGIFGLDNFGLSIIIFIIIFLTVGIFSYKFGLVNPAVVFTILFILTAFFNIVIDIIPLGIGSTRYLPTIIIGLMMFVFVIREVMNR